jgi:hypothetical protein
MHYRYHAPNLGRFLKPDNVPGSLGNPQSWNLYAYALGSPVNFTDPSGHMVGQAWGYKMCGSGVLQNNGLGGGLNLGGHPFDENPKGVVDWAIIDDVLKAVTSWREWYAAYGIGIQGCSYSSLDCSTDGVATPWDGIDVSFQLSSPPYPGARVILVTDPDNQMAIDAYAKALRGQLESGGWSVTTCRLLEEMQGCAERLDIIMHHREDNYWITGGEPVSDSRLGGAIHNMAQSGHLSSSARVYLWGCQSDSMVPVLAAGGIASLGFSGSLWVGACGAFSCSLPVVWP